MVNKIIESFFEWHKNLIYIPLSDLYLPVIF